MVNAMILVEINREQRQYVLDMSVILMSPAAYLPLRERLMSGVEYQGQYMCELTETERAWIVGCAHSTMNGMTRWDMNAWTTYDYRNLECLAGALYVDCAV